jgi:hypothetical protein
LVEELGQAERKPSLETDDDAEWGKAYRFPAGL